MYVDNKYKGKGNMQIHIKLQIAPNTGSEFLFRSNTL